jgi:sialidase-1
MLLAIIFLVFIDIKPSFENDTIVFKRGESGYFCIKIPSILTTTRGTLLAFGEARMFSCGDSTQTDIVYKRSLDNGKTWSDLQILYRGNSSNDMYNRVGNVAPVQLKYNQRILIPFCKNNLIVMQTYSDDDGLTFSPAQIISNVTKPEWKWVGLGPPGGLLLQSNRILIPAYYSTYPNDDGLLSTGYVMLNDFNGQVDKWYLGGEFDFETYFPNECQAVELLPNANSIFINARSLGKKRIGAYSNDGGITFNKINVLNTLEQPLTGCQGSTIYHENTRQLFYSGLAETSFIRTNLSLHISNDNGENWRYIKTIYPGSSAYSSLTIMNDQSIGLLYEWANNTDFVFLPDYITFTIVYNQTQKKGFY